MRGGYATFNQSITGIKTATELRPALQVKQSGLFMGKNGYAATSMPRELPALDKEVKEKFALDNSMDRSFQDSFDADHYENIRPAMFPTKIFTCPPEWKKRKLEPMDMEEDKNGDISRDDMAKSEVIDGQTSNKSQQNLQKAIKNREWVDLDKYIELLLDSKSEDEIVFIYCNPNPNGDPYDLQV